MYTEFFGLSCLPFSNTPDPRFFFKTPEHEEALARMQYCLAYHKGMLAVTGQAGTGKTLLTRLFLSTQAQAANVALVLHPQLSSDELLREIAREFGVNSMPSDSRSVLAARLQEFLIDQKQCGQNPLVIIDESHTIPGEAYDALRILSNLEVADSKLVDIFLFGQPSLRRNLVNPALHQLHQRLFSSVQLNNLSEEQTTGYIHFRLQTAGGGEEPIFEPAAIRRIYEYSGGLPRLINQACDNSLLTAFSAESKTVTSELAQEVIEQIIGIGSIDAAGSLSGAADGVGWNAGLNAGAVSVTHDNDGAARARVEAVLQFFARKESELKSAAARMDERLSSVDAVMNRVGLSNDDDDSTAIERIESQIQGIEASLSEATSVADRLADENNAAHIAAEKLSQASGLGDECTDRIEAAAEQSGHLLGEKAEEITDHTRNLLAELENRRVVVSDEAEAIESKVKEAQSAREALEASVAGLTDRQTQAEQVLAELAGISGQSENLVLTVRGNLEDVKEACDQSWSAANEAKQATEALARVTAEAIDAHRNAQAFGDQLPDAQRLLEAMEAAQARGQHQIDALQESCVHTDEQVLRCCQENDRAEATFQDLYDAESRAKQTAEQMTQVTTEAISAQQDVEGLLDQLPDVQRTIDTMQAAQAFSTRQIETQQEVANRAETQITRFAQESERGDVTLQNLAGAIDRGEETTGALQDVTAEAIDAHENARGLLNRLPEAQKLLEGMQAAGDYGTRQIETQKEVANHAEIQITRFAQESERGDVTLQNLAGAIDRGEETTGALQDVTAEAIDAHENARGLLNRLPEAQKLLEAMQAAGDYGAQQIKTQREVANHAETQIAHFARENERADAALQNLASASDHGEETTGALQDVTAEAIDAHENVRGLLNRIPEAQDLLEAMQAARDLGARQIETQEEIATHAETQIAHFAQESERGDVTLQNLARAADRGDQTTGALQRVTGEANDAHENAQGLLNRLPEAQNLLDALQAAQDLGDKQIETQQEIANHGETQITRSAQESERAEEAHRDLSQTLDRTETAVRQAAEAEQRLPNLIAEATALLGQLPMVQSALARYAEIEEKLDRKIEFLQARMVDAGDRLGALEEAAEQARVVGASLDKTSEQGRTTRAELADSVDRAQQKDDQLTVTTRTAESQCSQIDEQARSAGEIQTKLGDDLQTIRQERTAIRNAVMASRDVLRQVADTDKILQTKLEAYRAQQLEAHQHTAAIKKQMEDIRQQADGLDQVGEKLESIQAKVDDTAANVEQLDQNIETARSQIVAILAEPDRVLASIKSQIDRMMQVAKVSKKVHANISKASLNANRQLHSFRDLTLALDERMLKLSMADPMLDIPQIPKPLLRNRLSSMVMSNVIKKPASDRTPPSFTRDDAGFIAETART